MASLFLIIAAQGFFLLYASFDTVAFMIGTQPLHFRCEQRVYTSQTETEAYSSTHETKSSDQQLAASAQLHRAMNTKKAQVNQDDARLAACAYAAF